MGWVETTECLHCGAPRSASGTEWEGQRIRCRKYHKWYGVRRWVAEQAPAVPAAPPPVEQPAPAEPLDRSAVLPDDLQALGFKLVYIHDRMVAVSVSWGCSAASADLTEVVRSARNIVGFIRWANKKRKEES